MDLRDRFAAHFAGALLQTLSDPEELARRAYDLAEAMVRERDRRVDVEESEALAEDGEIPELPPAFFDRAPLLDDLEPMDPEPDWAREEDDLPDWLDTGYQQADVEPRWAPASTESRAPESPGSVRPGLARTSPDAARIEGPKSQRTG